MSRAIDEPQNDIYAFTLYIDPRDDKSRLILPILGLENAKRCVEDVKKDTVLWQKLYNNFDDFMPIVDVECKYNIQVTRYDPNSGDWVCNSDECDNCYELCIKAQEILDEYLKEEIALYAQGLASNIGLNTTFEVFREEGEDE
ncbi:hypothetical protein LCGC14_1499450 [marine sediment metagenome]|uniref:Uncharacterized protein n=1 Tax=marine sediment metagenome TaxID=412755 RepID=A0A0F9M5X8_9ZZZZ|nr:hypothetical protein [Candidatus Scalindua sp.]